MLTDKRVDEIFAEMNGYVLELANEPSMLGPQYFQDKIAICRGHLNKVSLVVSELNREKLEVSGELRRLEAVYAMEYDNLIANDPRVKSLANIEDRKATAGFILREQRGKINGLKDRLANLDGVSRVVSFRNRELQATMTAIRDQRRLMQTELSTGAFYGDERTPKSQRPPREGNGIALDDEISVAELDALMADAPAEPTDSTPESPATVESEPEAAKPTPESENPQITQEAPSTNAPVQEAAPETAPQSVSDEDAIMQFLDAPDEALPQAVVEQPNHEVPAGTEAASEVDDFISILEGL